MKVTSPIKDLTCTQTLLSRALGLSTARVNQLIDLGVVIRDEKDPSGGVMLFQSIKNYYQSKSATDDRNDADFWQEKGRHERAKRQLAELKLAKEEGRIYSASVVENVMIEQLAGLRTHLSGLGVKLAPLLVGKTTAEIASIIGSEVEERLEELSEYKPELFDENERGLAQDNA